MNCQPGICPSDDDNLPEASTTDPSRILDSNEYEVYENIPVFVEHTRTLKSGRELHFGRNELEMLAQRSNRRIDETGDFAPVVVGHTSPDPSAPDPPKIGWAGPFRLGWLTKDHNKYAVLADFRIEKDKVPLLSKYPRRSAELWAEDRYEDMYLDPISLLGADTPWSDMGVLYSKKGDDSREKIYYSIAPQAPGPYGTGFPQPVKITNDTTKTGDKEKYSMEEDDFTTQNPRLTQDQKDIAQTIISAIFDSPEFNFLRKMMGKEVADSVKPSDNDASDDGDETENDSYLQDNPKPDDEDSNESDNFKNTDNNNKSFQNNNENADDSSSDSDDSSDHSDEGFDEEEEYLRRKYFGSDDDENDDDDEDEPDRSSKRFRNHKHENFDDFADFDDEDDEDDEDDDDEDDKEDEDEDEDDNDRKSLYRKRDHSPRIFATPDHRLKRKSRHALYAKREPSVMNDEPTNNKRRGNDREVYEDMTFAKRNKFPVDDNEAEEKTRYTADDEFEEENEEETSGINKDDYPDDYGREYREFEERARRKAELDRARQQVTESDDPEQYEEGADGDSESVEYEKDEEDDDSKFFKTDSDTNDDETTSNDEDETDTQIDDEDKRAKARYSRARERFNRLRRRPVRYSRSSVVHESSDANTKLLEQKLASLESKLSRIERAFEWTTDKVITAERYSKLHDLRANFIFDEDSEREKCRYSKMSDSQFEEHCREIQKNYRQVPTNIDVPSWLVQNAPEYEDRPGAVQYSKEKSADIERQVAELAESYASQGIYKPSEEIRNEVAKKMRHGR